MKEVSEHICELLYDHDCVIVPQLGGFLASYAGASIHPVNHTIYPPMRKVAFNVFLRTNDGLLANQLSHAEKTSYGDALRKVEMYAQACSRDLDGGRRILIAGLGTLYKDAEGNIQFEPDASANFLRDSFGLSPIRHLPLNRNRVIASPAKQRPSVKPERKKTSSKTLSRVLLAGAVVWLGVNAFFVLKDKDFSGILSSPVHTETPAAKQEPTTSNEASVQPPVVTETTAALLSLPESSVVNASEPVSHPEPAVRVEEKPAAPQQNFTEAEISNPVTAPALAANNTLLTEQNYFLIAGAFKITSNAEAFVDELHRKGFPNARILQSRHPLTLVCYDGYVTRREANEALDTLQGEGWVFRK